MQEIEKIIINAVAEIMPITKEKISDDLWIPGEKVQTIKRILVEDFTGNANPTGLTFGELKKMILEK